MLFVSSSSVDVRSVRTVSGTATVNAAAAWPSRAAAGGAWPAIRPWQKAASMASPAPVTSATGPGTVASQVASPSVERIDPAGPSRTQTWVTPHECRPAAAAGMSASVVTVVPVSAPSSARLGVTASRGWPSVSSAARRAALGTLTGSRTTGVSVARASSSAAARVGGARLPSSTSSSAAATSGSTRRTSSGSSASVPAMSATATTSSPSASRTAR